jgi:hypothetical protein
VGPALPSADSRSRVTARQGQPCEFDMPASARKIDVSPISSLARLSPTVRNDHAQSIRLVYAPAVGFADSMVVRLCERGHADLRERWLSAEAAERDGVWALPWNCPVCYSSSFALVVPAPRRPQPESLKAFAQPDVAEEVRQADPAISPEAIREADRELEMKWRTREAGQRLMRVMAQVREVAQRGRSRLLRRAQ